MMLKAKFFLVLCFLVAIVWVSTAQAKLNLNQEFLNIDQKLKQNPSDLNLQMDKAYIFTQGLEFQRAVDIYNAVHQKDPSNQRAVNELCVLYTQMGAKEQALEFCQKKVEMAPKDYLSYDNLGLSQYKLGNMSGALQAFFRALELNPSSVLIRYHIATVFLALQEFEAARDYLQHSLSLPDMTRQERFLLYHGLYWANTRLGEYKQAYQAALQSYDLSQNHLFLGKVVSAFIKAHQFWVFCVVSLMCLWLCHYLGKRLNRFLKNELD